MTLKEYFSGFSFFGFSQFEEGEFIIFEDRKGIILLENPETKMLNWFKTNEKVNCEKDLDNINTKHLSLKELNEYLNVRVLSVCNFDYIKRVK